MIGLCAVGIWGFPSKATADTLHTLDGKTYDGEIRLEGGQSLHVIDRDGRNAAVKLSHLLDATFDGAATAALSRGVVLVDGTALAGSVDSIGEKFVRITPPGRPTMQVPFEQIARVVFQPVPPDLTGKLPSGSSGLLLKGGDFLEAQLRNYDGRSVRMDSVLLGVADFDTQDRAVALILKPAKELDGDTIIRTTHGSEFCADHIEIAHGQLRCDAIGIGPMTLQRNELAEIHTGGGGRLISLTDLRPTAIEGGDPAHAYRMDTTDIGLPPRLIGTELKHSITIPAGASATFDLDGKYDVFTAKVGIPEGVVPTGQLRFSVLVDGKEAATATQNSVDDPASLGVDIRHAKKLTLVVTALSPAASGIVGLWGDPQLVKHGGLKTVPATQ